MDAFFEFYKNADYAQLLLFSALNGSAIVLNIVLLYAISTRYFELFLLRVVFLSRRTPKLMRSYSIFLLNNAIVDIVSACASALAAIRC